jgi:SAM-dependent methyltransferase
MEAKKKVVRDGYDTVGAAYTAVREPNDCEVSFLRDLVDRLPEYARVLDAGCGGGTPLVVKLREDLDVTAVDISEEQIAAARNLARRATFLHGDMTEIDLPDESFDAIYSLYAVIHVPRLEHRPLLAKFHRWLRPGGLLLLCTGAEDLPEDVAEYFGASMYWSHYDAATNLAMLAECGFEVLRRELVRDTLDQEIESRHLFAMAVKPAYPGVASLVGAAGTLPRPMTWNEIEEAGREERAEEVMWRKRGSE